MAKSLAAQHSLAEVRQQIEWLAARAPRKNALGLLRRAIEEGWPNPKSCDGEGSDEGLFARHFYAGLAGNPGLPVAQPSSRDLEQARPFVEQLRKTRLAEVDLSAWARAFAGYVRERRTDRDVTSLVLALRLHGDAWLLRFAQDQQAQKSLGLELARVTHRARFEGGWLSFLAKTETVCRTQKADAYREFETKWKQNRWRLSGTDLQRDRLLEFQRHFAVPDFWYWDAEFNSTPFKVG